MLDLLGVVLALGAPLMLAAVAGWWSERSGVVNIGLEGLMLLAAVAGALGGVRFGPVGGLFAALGATTALSLVHWLATQRFRVDHVVSGMAVNAFAAGASNFLWQKLSDPNRSGAIPTVPNAALKVLAILAPVAVALYAVRTRPGLALAATGSDPDKARLAGISPPRVRLFALAMCGLFAGIAGLQLVAENGVFTDNMTAGRGYIALAALILGGWRPLPAALAGLGFGALYAVRLRFMGTTLGGFSPPSELWAALPYLATVLALAGVLGRGRPPAGLGKA